jgi:hypothetical protein
MLMDVTASRGRAQDATPDQREEAGIVGQGRVPSVRMGWCADVCNVDGFLFRNLESRLAAQGSQPEFRD